MNMAIGSSGELANERPDRVGHIEIHLQLPSGFASKHNDLLMAVVEHRTVHNSMVQMPEDRITAQAIVEAA